MSVDLVAAVPQPADQDAEQGVPGAGQVIGAAGATVADRESLTEIWRIAAAQTSAGTKSSGRSMSGARPVSVDEPDQRAHLGRGAPRAGVDAADDVKRPVDRHRQARPGRVPQQLFRHVLGLDVAHAQPLGVAERRLLGHLADARDAEAREHGGGGDVVHGYAPVPARQPDHLPGAGHVGGPQLLVRVDEVHQRARVVDHVDARARGRGSARRTVRVAARPGHRAAA